MISGVEPAPHQRARTNWIPKFKGGQFHVLPMLSHLHRLCGQRNLCLPK